MKTIKVGLKKRSYNIYVGKGAVNRLSSLSGVIAKNSPIFVVTNRKIRSLFHKDLTSAISGLSEKVFFCEVPDSETAKSFRVYEKTVGLLTDFSKRSTPLVIALGGGVVGDLSGFVASTFRRGVPYVQVPTTLLGQVDSAIGGKVAIDIPRAKNIIGNFYQPKLVLCDTDFLKSLPKKEFRNALAEIIKYGIIKDSAFFYFIEKNHKKLIRLEPDITEYAIAKCCGIKARVVEKDEFDEKDKRAILNFGHTVGHAIEASLKFSLSMPHGEAVARGMIIASDVALRMKMLSDNDFKRVKKLIKKVCGISKNRAMKTSSVLSAMRYDKKFVGGVNKFVLPTRIGNVKVVRNIPAAIIKKAITDNL